MYGDQDKTTPGNALASQPDTPFHSLKKFGTNFLDRLESTQLPSPILKRVTLIDTPGVLNGEKQRSRGYDYEAVIRWFAQHSDRVLLLFDAHKTDIGDEFRQVVQHLRTPYSCSSSCACPSPNPVALALASALPPYRWCSSSASTRARCASC